MFHCAACCGQDARSSGAGAGLLCGEKFLVSDTGLDLLVAGFSQSAQTLAMTMTCARFNKPCFMVLENVFSCRLPLVWVQEMCSEFRLLTDPGLAISVTGAPASSKCPMRSLSYESGTMSKTWMSAADRCQKFVNQSVYILAS